MIVRPKQIEKKILLQKVGACLQPFYSPDAPRRRMRYTLSGAINQTLGRKPLSDHDKMQFRL